MDNIYIVNMTFFLSETLYVEDTSYKDIGCQDSSIWPQIEPLSCGHGSLRSDLFVFKVATIVFTTLSWFHHNNHLSFKFGNCIS